MAGGRDESNIFFNEKDDDYGVIAMVWMGPDAPTPTNLLIVNLLIHQSTYTSPMILSKTSTLVGKIHFVDNSNHFNTFTLNHGHHHNNYPRHSL